MKGRRGRGEGEIRQRPDGRWEARASFGYDHTGGRVCKSVYGKSKAEVGKKLAQLALSGPPRGTQGIPSVAEFFAQYLAHVQAQNSVATWRLRTTIAKRYILPAFGPLRLHVITPRHVAALLQDLHRRNIGKQTIQTVHSTLRAALAYALRLELVEKNACAAIPRPRASSEPRRMLTIEESRRLLSVAKAQDRDFALYVLALTTGMRQGEILGLQWDRVDFGERRVRIDRTLTEDTTGRLTLTPPKTSSSRRNIDLPDVAIEALCGLHHEQENSGYVGSWVFPDSQGGPQRKSNFIRR
jgi:integrase